MTMFDGSLSILPIVFDEVSVTAGAVTLLDRVSLTLAAGAPTVLIGPNGAGKTTLLRAAMGLARSSGGQITWAGRATPPPARRASNIAYALRAAGVPRPRRKPAIGELLAVVGLEHLGRRPARRLSGGEQQRLALARALALDPAVLFLDEPTASLDPAGTQAVEDIIGDIAGRGIKIVLSTHDLGEAKRLAGQLVLLHRGRAIEVGAATAFFDAPRTAEARKFIAGELLV
jgi:tungstate transport system ATP-binding protein